MSAILYGDATCVCTPNVEIVPVKIYVAAIRESSPMSSDPAIVEDPPDTLATQKTVGHEVGHRVLITYNSADGRLTVMVLGFASAGIVGGYTNPTWSNIPTGYDDIDTGQLQVSQFALR
jgi:hypothetical protein